jgi:hypothetical protein
MCIILEECCFLRLADIVVPALIFTMLKHGGYYKLLKSYKLLKLSELQSLHLLKPKTYVMGML